MKIFKIVLAMVVVLVALTGCKTGGGGGGGSDDGWGNNDTREFYIGDHDLLVGEKECYLNHLNAGWNLADIIGVCGYYIGADEEVLDYEHVYGAAFYTTNDQANTRYMYIEIYDQNNTLVNDGKFEAILNGQPVDFTMVPEFIIWLEDQDAGKTFTVEVWIRDANGVESEIYIFDISAIGLG